MGRVAKRETERRRKKKTGADEKMNRFAGLVGPEGGNPVDRLREHLCLHKFFSFFENFSVTLKN